MKIHTTNYENTFIEVADDCPVRVGDIPPTKGDTQSVANIQFDILKNNPYKFTSDDILFEVFAKRNNVPKEELQKAREQFFSKGQACFRASPLPKRYGWGVHSNEKGQIAIYAVQSDEYKKLSEDISLKHLKAMCSKRG